MSRREPQVADGESRNHRLTRVIATIGTVTREFTARGSYPFRGRALGRSQMDLLFVLSQSDGMGVGDLAAALGVTSGAITQLVDTLRAVGLVASEVNPVDRRGRIIRLTDAAAGEVDAFQREYVAALAPRFASLTTTEIAELDRLLSKVAAPHLAEPSGNDRGETGGHTDVSTR